MRHARPEDLDRLEPLLEKLRRLRGMKEKSRGLFYRGSRAFLHFHEHDDFERLPATTRVERNALVVTVRKALSKK